MTLADKNFEVIRVYRRQAPVMVLGPGRRAVVWVQGCPLGCKGCIVPESWDDGTGESVSVHDLACWVSRQPAIEGITLTGGEPMEQAGALVGLVDLLRVSDDFGVVCYTGYTLERLHHMGTKAQKALLERTDLLIDGPYIEHLHSPLLWRGSSNQRLVALTGRYRCWVPEPNSDADKFAGLQLLVDTDGSFSFVGVPPQPRFRQTFQQLMLDCGVTLRHGEEDSRNT
jgi:anaerobic ribonucleoside-triphosphate reductase activating protein